MRSFLAETISFFIQSWLQASLLRKTKMLTLWRPKGRGSFFAIFGISHIYWRRMLAFDGHRLGLELFLTMSKKLSKFLDAPRAHCLLQET